MRKTLLLASIITLICFKSVQAQVLISEIMYHPQELDLTYPEYEDREDAEFIEIWNSGNSLIDISDYTLKGISYCFPSGTILNPDQRIVLTRNATIFQQVFGQTNFGVYKGSLSNQGEKIQLLNKEGVVLHTVDYNDKEYWPSIADGQGHSLELICSNCDTERYSNWIASIHPNGHTANAVNSKVIGGDYPSIDSIHLNPVKPNSGEIVSLMAWMPAATSATLDYTVNFGNTQSINGNITGEVATFNLPAFAASDIIHYTVKANNTFGTFSMPREDGHMNSNAFVITNPDSIPSNYPILNWYFDESSPDSQYTTLEYDGKIISNIYSWFRRNKHWRLEFPKGHKFEMPGLTTISVSDLQLNRPDHIFSARINGTMARTALYTNIISEQGEPKFDAFNVRVDMNGERGYIWTYLTWPNQDWYEKTGITEGHEYYKFPTTKVPGIPNPVLKYPEGGDTTSVIEALSMKDVIGPHLMDMYDIPRMVNFMALSTLICHWDAGMKNFYMHKHPNGRWEGDIWDVDAVPLTGLKVNDEATCLCGEMPRQGFPSNPAVSNATHPSNGGNTFALPLLENVPRVKAMYHRRLRTLIDFYYKPNELIDRVEVMANPTDSDVLRTTNHYAANHDIAQHQQNIFVEYPKWQLAKYNSKADFPLPASGSTDIVINEIQYAPAGGHQEEFIELYNNTNESVDMSQWQVEGVGLTFPHGTVILPNDFLVVASWSPTFIDKYGSGKYVAADFNGSELRNSGETLRLLKADSTIEDEVTYEEHGWKKAHGGVSLERINTMLASNDRANWAPSNSPFGSPDAANNPNVNTNFPPSIITENLVINEIMYHADTLNEFSSKDLEYIEILNNQNVVLDASGIVISGVDYIFPDGTLLAPNAIIVIAANRIAFKTKYGFFPFDVYNGTLSNKGERIELINTTGYTIDKVTYNNKNPWDEAPDGEGYSLELLHPSLNSDDPLNWFRSDDTGGTPEAENSRVCDQAGVGIIINEINYNSDNLNFDPGNWIELYNPTANAVDLSGWTLYDNGSAFVLPQGTNLLAEDYIVLVENQANFSSAFPTINLNKIIGEFTFGLSNKGERISLFDNNKCLADYVIYNDKAPWPTEPNGDGSTLALIDPALDNALAPYWKASNDLSADFIYGSPGKSNLCAGISNTIVCSQISSSADDAEENLLTDSVSISSTDLDLVNDDEVIYTVGLRFQNIDVPQGARITSAVIEFAADEVNTDSTSLIFKGENIDDAPVFTAIKNNITSRTTTSNSATWQPDFWNTIGDNGINQKTVDLSSIIQEIIDRPNFIAGNAIALLVHGTGTRTAESFDGDAQLAPKLCITYSSGGCGITAKLLLEGFYDSASSNMRIKLEDKNLLPLSQPFNTAPWNYTGTESTPSIPTGISDWILIATRDNNGDMINQSAGFVNQDGALISVDGHLGIPIPDAVGKMISVHHKSHLAVISTDQYVGGIYDFTTAVSQAEGIEQLKLIDGKYMLYSGDYDGTGIINSNDFNKWKVQSAVLNQYLNIDGDGNGIINSLDYNLWQNNKSKVGQPSIRY